MVINIKEDKCKNCICLKCNSYPCKTCFSKDGFNCGNNCLVAVDKCLSFDGDMEEIQKEKILNNLKEKSENYIESLEKVIKGLKCRQCEDLNCELVLKGSCNLWILQDLKENLMKLLQ